MLYLASQSPQRIALLKQAEVPFQVVATTGDEDAVVDNNPMLLALEKARVKARGAVLDDYLAQWTPADVVLGADTIVACGQQIFGKPHNDDDARRMLSTLSGTRHQVITGQVMVTPATDGQPELEACFIALAHVTMRELSTADIDAYLDTGESAERSGGYAIQESADQFVTETEGAQDTIIGLNVASVFRLYRELTEQELPGRQGQERQA